MQRTLRFLMGALALLIASAFSSNGFVAAASTAVTQACAATISPGDYAFFTATTVRVGAGTVIALPEALWATTPAVLATSGTVSFDGAGNVRLTATTDPSGAAITPMAYAGTYSLAGCEIIVQLADGIRFTARVISSAEAPILVSTTPGLVLVEQP